MDIHLLSRAYGSMVQILAALGLSALLRYTVYRLIFRTQCSYIRIAQEQYFHRRGALSEVHDFILHGPEGLQIVFHPLQRLVKVIKDMEVWCPWAGAQ